MTGATGLIGSHLVRRLAEQSVSLRALVRPSSNCGPLRELNVELVEGDLGDDRALRQALEGVSEVYHCAGLVSDWGARKAFHQINAEGTRRLVNAALSVGIRRLVHLSSAAVYGYHCHGVLDESTPLASRGIPYIESKIAAEVIIQRAVAEKHLPAVMLRPVMVFGPGSQHYVGEFVKHLRGGSMILMDGGRHVAGLAYVENVVDACLLASRADVPPGTVVNVCDGSDVTWKQYIAALASGIGVPAPRFSLPTKVLYPMAILSELAGRCLRLRSRPLLTRLAVLELGQSQRYDISRARQQLNYSPRIGFDEALSKTIDWVKATL